MWNGGNMDDDNYDDEYDYDNSQDKYKHYFKFDPEAWDAWGKWLYSALNDMVESSPNVWYAEFVPKSLPVNSYFSNAGKDKNFQYLGNNYDNAKIWKKKYFAHDKVQHSYINHVTANSQHFLQQPTYYKGLFDILN